MTDATHESCKQKWLDSARDFADAAEKMVMQAEDTPVSDAILALCESVKTVIAQLRPNAATPAPQAVAGDGDVRCDRCDGCGWYEGGPTIKTDCEKCGGTGAIRGAPPTAFGPPVPPAPADGGQERNLFLPWVQSTTIPTNVIDQSGLRVARCDFDGMDHTHARDNARIICEAVNKLGCGESRQLGVAHATSPRDAETIMCQPSLFTSQLQAINEVPPRSWDDYEQGCLLSGEDTDLDEWEESIRLGRSLPTDEAAQLIHRCRQYKAFTAELTAYAQSAAHGSQPEKGGSSGQD